MMKRASLVFAPVALHSLVPPSGRQRCRQEQQQQRQRNGSRSHDKDIEGTAAAPASKSFWCCEAETVALQELKRNYANDRFLDKKTRFVVRQRLREGGVMSNLYFLKMVPESPLYTYEVEATRRLFHAKPSDAECEQSSVGKAKGRKKKNGGVGAAAKATATTTTVNTSGPIIKRVDATRAWRVVQRFLQRRVPDAPPLVCVRQKVYATAPLPATALQLPAEFLDLGWEACTLRFLGRVPMAQLDPTDVQELTNKIVLWALQQHSALNKKYAVARDSNGKMVYTHDSITVGGLRIFKGTVVRAVFIDTRGAIEVTPSAVAAVSPPPPSSSVLTTLSAGHHTAEALRFLVKEFLREFEYKGTPVQSYRIEDASGVTMASMWKATKAARLQVGVVYEATNFRVRVFESRGGMRLVEMTVGETALKVVEQRQDEEDEEDASSSAKASKRRQRKGGKRSAGKEEEQQQHVAPKAMPGELALKIDTKGTVAAELSLWEEVKQHFGSGPYDSATEERIARSVQGTPVITSATLRHSSIRLVRFNIVPSEIDLDPALQRFACELEPSQPYAVLSDYTVVPLQALHCCYDPRMKSWQDITVAACSLLPAPRLDILEMFRAALEGGLQRWGLALAPQPWSSRALSLLPTPQKTLSRGLEKNGGRRHPQQQQKTLRHPPPPAFPTTVAVVAIAVPHAGEEERARVTQTAQALARAFRTTTTITVTDEKEAVRYLVQQLTTTTATVDGALTDPNTAAVIVAAERDTRPSRWVHAECLSRGIHAVFMPPAASPKHQALMCENTRVRLRNAFEVNPVRGVDIAREVPAVAQRRVLVVGIDACHTTTFSTGSIVGVLCAPERNHVLPIFWKHEARGQEVDQVAEHFQLLLQRACELYDGLDEVVVFQDGDVYSEMHRMQPHVPPGCGFTFMCLHKRSNVRFVHCLGAEHSALKTRAGNVVKGAVVQALTPVLPDAVGRDTKEEATAPSFYLQNHDCNMSTARTVHYTVHSTSPTLDVSDVQQLSHALSHVMATQATKLPMPTRCAHRLASVAERLLDAAPPLQCSMIPAPLNERLWFF
ncbi:argonaute-like protein [Trypanosoma grayi]|uniref:argonaute-like protein n=1 Tax=Trypanosoma grayi TaxID=71804 RepID=UPI0004F479A1|nr:argonaute-like protein [Trypanosoma grayi]KEG11913.1 argonaute-like protein [Trypanosoma grayi]